MNLGMYFTQAPPTYSMRGNERRLSTDAYGDGRTFFLGGGMREIPVCASMAGRVRMSQVCEQEGLADEQETVGVCKVSVSCIYYGRDRL